MSGYSGLWREDARHGRTPGACIRGMRDGGQNRRKAAGTYPDGPTGDGRPPIARRVYGESPPAARDGQGAARSAEHASLSEKRQRTSDRFRRYARRGPAAKEKTSTLHGENIPVRQFVALFQHFKNNHGIGDVGRAGRQRKHSTARLKRLMRKSPDSFATSRGEV